MNKKLIVIEGFDRSGKDTLMNDLSNIGLDNCYIMFNDLEGLPKYDKEQESFLQWLNRFIEKQINSLNNLFDDYDTIIMTRFIVSDEVYSTLFNREHTVINYIGQLRRDINIINYCILFESFEEYEKRVKKLNLEVQYSKEDFDKINDLYEQKLDEYNSKINYIKSETTNRNILEKFITFYNGTITEI